ncbi:MAG: hypothetical protein WCJ37_01785 [Syntrophus sp. (in: bacteria)]
MEPEQPYKRYRGKIDLRKLRELIEQEGKNQVECALHFDCSTAAICKAVKKLPRDEPESMRDKTEQQKTFIRQVAERGMTPTQAAMVAYKCSTPDSAATMGKRLMKDPDIGTAIHDLLYQEGIGRRRRAQRLRDMVESSDFSAVGKGLDLAAKMCGDLAPAQLDINVTYDAAGLRDRMSDLRAMLEEANTIDIGDEQEVPA